MEKIAYCTHVDKSEHFTEVSRLYAYSLPSGMEAKPNDVLVVENLSSCALVQCVCVIDEKERAAKRVLMNLGQVREYSDFEDQILEASRMISCGEKTPDDFIGSYLDEIEWSNMNDPLPRPRRARSIR